MNDRRHLPQPLLAEAARRYGVNDADLHLIRHVQNCVYRFEREGGHYILRLTDGLRKTCEEIAGELDWIRHLAAAGLSVCQPVPSQRNRVMETLADGDDLFYAAAFHAAAGTAIAADDVTPALFDTLGQLMGRLHAATKDYHPSIPSVRRPRWQDTHGYNRDLDHLPAEQVQVRARLRRLVESLQALPKDRDSYGLIHADVQFSNCFLDDGRLHLFDCDHCEYGYFAADIAATVFWCAIHTAGGGAERVAKFWPTFWAAYCRENKLDPLWLQLLPEFIRLRDAWTYVHFHRIHDMPLLMSRDERIRRDFQVWRQRIEDGIGPVDVAFI